jgi:Holliday junction resolvase RusA-like endonuclease
MQASFNIMGQPMGKQRPRVTKWGTHTPIETVNYETLVQMIYQQKIHKILEGPLKIYIDAYYQIAKSTSKKKRSLMLQDKIRPTKKPDLDNIAKIICDSLNTIAYKDDSQIVEMEIRKFYSDVPRVVVTLKELKEGEVNEIKDII